ncbi:haloacid dehalogenase [Corynespora cassiicola Philippines]|uniref:Haloacid dehalogenase n=1 Tax=Corynespora cassiicola Philippines TaxID=1448308 RepID=A0A2T2NMV6_CORCC|nr:haloacid dehalogenase [Corynespora cassiicola Philippines]
MQPTRIVARKKNLLLAFDAFGTLYQPSSPVPKVYSKAAWGYGIDCSGDNGLEDVSRVKEAFGRAFKKESKQNPNYGKATGLGAEKWWGNLIRNTFEPFLEPNQQVPQELVDELLTRFSTRDGYYMFPDVIPLFQMLQSKAKQQSTNSPWKWDKTVVGIITNSDDRVSSILESFGLKVGPRRIGTSVQRSAQANLEEDISFVVLSYDVGLEKPDSRVFDAAVGMLRETLAASGAGAEGTPDVDDFEKLYVGDSLKHDYYGAKGAGWNALLLDRERKYDIADGQMIARVPSSQAGGNSGEDIEVIRDFGALSMWSPPSS